MAKIVIIGAGLTGLSAAYHLEQNNFFDYKLFEKNSQIGGLCRSVHQDGFTFDYTGHLLHINNNYFKEFIKTIFDFKNLHTVTRKSFIYSHDTYTPYPYQTNLYGLPADVITDCITGFIQRKKQYKNPKLYHQWVLKHFGTGFAKHFFFPYQQKIFDFNAKKLSSSWTQSFIPKTSLKTIIRGSLEQNQESIGYNKQFFYPKSGGIFSWLKKIAEKLTNPIHTNFCAKTIDMKEKTIIFEHTNNGNTHTEKFDTLITTMPLDILLKSLKEPPHITLKHTSKKLLCNSVTNFNWGVFSKNNYKKHWIYYPEKKYPFYRMGFYHNFSPSMAPQGCSAIYGELSHVNKSKNFINNKLKLSLKEAKKLLKISDQEILTQKIIHIPHAYVIYDLWRDKNLPKIHKLLHANNIYSIGRYGQWKYSSMQDAILDGKSTIEQIIFASTRLRQGFDGRHAWAPFLRSFELQKVKGESERTTSTNKGK